MSDAAMAGVARGLAQALMRFGKSRDAQDSKEVLRLQTELCAAFRAEEAAEAAAAQEALGSPPVSDPP